MDTTIRRRIAARTIWTLTLVTALGACASPTSRSPFRGVAPSREGLTIEVENGYVMDVRVYLMRGSTRIPMGFVGAAERRTFRLGTAEVGHRGDIRLLADPIGSREPYLTDVIQVAEGSRVVWSLGHALAYSRVTVY